MTTITQNNTGAKRGVLMLFFLVIKVRGGGCLIIETVSRLFLDREVVIYVKVDLM